MSHSICFVFVALAIFQAAIASDAEKPKIIEVELTRMESSANDLFEGERAGGFIGDLTVGQRVSGDYYYSGAMDVTNSQNSVAEYDLRVTLNRAARAGIINYFKAENTAGDKIVFCATPTTVGAYSALVRLRVPPNAKSRIELVAATL